MAKAKDFSQLNVNGVYNAIAEATAEQDAEHTQEEHGTPEERPKRKERRTYNAQETAEILQTMKTAGHKGVKLPRINLAFAPQNYEYVQTMSRVRGENMTEFVNMIIQQHMEEHGDIYARAIEFKKSL